MPRMQITVWLAMEGMNGDGTGWCLTIRRGEVAFIQKPFKRHMLAAAIERVLANASKGR